MEADRTAAEAPAEAAWASQLHEGGPAIAAVVAFAPIERGDAVAAELDVLRDIDKVTGIRRLLQDEPVELFDDPAVAAGLAAVGDAGLTFDACVRAHQLPALTRLSRRAPQTTVVLDHLGKPAIDDEWGSPSATQWLEGLRALADEPNTLIKLSGQGSPTDPAYVRPRAPVRQCSAGDVRPRPLPGRQRLAGVPTRRRAVRGMVRPRRHVVRPVGRTSRSSCW